jgi:hypothetical protein
MKALLSFLVFVVAICNVSAQCIEGDCNYGKGILKTKEYTYDGTFDEGKFKRGKLKYNDGSLILDGLFGVNEAGISYLKEGTYTQADGSSSRGTFILKDNELLLQGNDCVERLANGHEYSGVFENGHIIQGRHTYPSDSKNNYYEGSFKLLDDVIVYHGKGYLYARGTASKTGPEWINGKISTIETKQPVMPEGKSAVQLTEGYGGILNLRGEVRGNGHKHTYDFIFDTGAALVSVPYSMFNLLVSQHVVTSEDFKEKISLQNASADIIVGRKFNLKELVFMTKDGKEIVLTNIDAVVIGSDMNKETPILLGQSALRKFQNGFEIDYNNLLFIVKK